MTPLTLEFARENFSHKYLQTFDIIYPVEARHAELMQHNVKNWDALKDILAAVDAPPQDMTNLELLCSLEAWLEVKTNLCLAH